MKNSTKIPNSILKSNKLSLNTKGLYPSLGYLFTIPNFKFTQKSLKMLCCNGEDAITSAINELKAHGYLKINKSTDYKTGQYTYSYTLLSEPNLETKSNTYSTEPAKNIYIAPNDNFTFIPNEIITDKTTGLEHKAVFSLFVMFKNNSNNKIQISLDYIKSLSTNGVRSFNRIFKELKKMGYIIQNKICAGKFTYEYIISKVKDVAAKTINIIKSQCDDFESISKNISTFTGEQSEHILNVIKTAIDSKKGIKVNHRHITHEKTVQAFQNLRFDNLQDVSNSISKFKNKPKPAYLLACIYNSLNKKNPSNTQKNNQKPLEDWEIEMLKELQKT